MMELCSIHATHARLRMRARILISLVYEHSLVERSETSIASRRDRAKRDNSAASETSTPIVERSEYINTERAQRVNTIILSERSDTINTKYERSEWI
jgi:hypothetical protein